MDHNHREVLEQIRRKQGRTIAQISKAADIMPMVAIGAKKALIEQNLIFEHPVNKGLYIAKPKVEEEPVEEKVEVDLHAQLREEFAKLQVVGDMETAVEEAVAEVETQSEEVEEQVSVNATGNTWVGYQVISDEAVLDFMKGKGRLTLKQIGDFFGRKPQGLASQLHKLRKQGRVLFFAKTAIVKNPRYEVPETLAALKESAEVVLATPSEKLPEADYTVPTYTGLAKTLEQQRQVEELERVNDKALENLCERIVGMLEEGSSEFQDIRSAFDLEYNDLRAALNFLSKRQRIVRIKHVAGEVWVLNEKGRNARRIDKQEILTLLADGEVRDSYFFAEHFERSPTSFGSLLNRMVMDGSIIRVTDNPATYRLACTDIGDVMAEIDQFISVKNKPVDDEQPKPEWLAALQKLQLAFGGATGSMLGEIQGYLKRRTNND